MNGIVWNGSDIGGDAVGEFDFLPLIDEAIFEIPLEGIPPIESDLLGTAGPKTPARRRRKRVNTLQVELLSLHESKDVLERRLMELESRREERLQTMSASALKWEQLARNQLHLKLKTMSENQRLRATLAEQSTLRRELEEIVLKKSRLLMMKMEDEQWRVLKLSADSEKRLVAIHAIANQQFETIDSQMLQFGLMEDATNDLWNIRTDTSPEGVIVGQGMRCTLLHGSLSAVVDASWKTILHVQVQPKSPTFVLGAVKSYSIDDDTVYLRTAFRCPDGDAKAEMSMIMKKQVMDDGRVVRLVFRTILDDEAHPFDANSYVSDQYGWIHMEEVDGGDGAMVRYKSYVHSNMAHPKRQDVDALAQLMGAIHLEDGRGIAKMADPATFMLHVFETAFRSFETIFLGLLNNSTNE
ncbi:Aste57867_3178 [Aphanomyces stellatus]|uniref:Aste57867_3178 protein n=1 Tax=Aphanomyces stellatus TaxID=120398 RepID=A0A485KBL4_9STRA|nr:hypothetical protein As57867_003169 [Aphanomyces stellatus]VFT80352.1 Aste57867_3178 [Aphanomyces stellatus]